MKQHFLVSILLVISTPSLYSMLPSLPSERNTHAARRTPATNALSAAINYQYQESEPEHQVEQPPELHRSRKACVICLERLYNKAESVVQLPCSRKHAFHYLCISLAHGHMSDNRTCPLCRAETLEHIVSQQSVDLLNEQLEQEKTDRRHLESVAFFKEERIQELLRKNESLAHQNSCLLEEITRLQYPAPEEYNVAQHPPRSGKKRNRKRKRYWHAHNQQAGQDNPAPEA